MIINLFYLTVVSKPGPLATPRFAIWHNARGLSAFMEASRFNERLVFLSTFRKKNSEFLAKTFFFNLQLRLARYEVYKCSKIQEVPGLLVM